MLAAFGGFLLFVLGIQRMEYFVLVLLVLRSSLDVSRLNGDAQSQSIANPSSVVALMFLAVGLTWILVPAGERRAAPHELPPAGTDHLPRRRRPVRHRLGRSGR